MKLKTILFIFFYQISNYLYAQNISMQWFTSDNGLPQNTIKDITKDKSGLIWIATEDGLVRFDGYNLENINHHKLKNERFRFFYHQNNNDTIYIGNSNEENIVGITNRKTFVRKHSFIDPNYKSILHSRFNIETIESINDITFQFHLKNSCYNIKEDQLTFENKKNKLKKLINLKISKTRINNFFTQNEFLFYIDKNEKIAYQFKSEKIHKINANSLFFSNESKIFWSKINNQVFIFNKNSLYKCEFLKNNLKLKKIANLDILDSYGIISLFYDTEYNKLYLGTAANGLCVLTFTSFKSVKKSNFEDDAIVYSHLQYNDYSIVDSKGDVFSKNGLIKSYKFSGKRDKYSMIYDNEDNIWIKNYFTLYKYDKQKKYKLTDSIEMKCRMIAVCDFENFNAIGFEKKDYSGYINLYPNNDFKTPIKTYNFKKSINCILQPSANELLVGTRDGLYNIFIKTNKIIKINNRIEVNIRNIVNTKSGNIWVLTNGNGIYLLKKKQLIKMPFDDKKHLKTTHTILEDKKGYFWLPTNNGLFKIKESNLLEFVNQNKAINYYKFTKESGFNTNEALVKI